MFSLNIYSSCRVTPVSFKLYARLQLGTVLGKHFTHWLLFSNSTYCEIILTTRAKPFEFDAVFLEFDFILYYAPLTPC